jgi:CRISPR-associated protein Cmr5
MTDKSTLSNRQTLEQQRAAKAWEQTEATDKRDYKQKYGSLVRGLPARIQTDGLGQTLAFLLAKAKDSHQNEHYAAYNHLNVWLSGREQFNFEGDLFQWLLKQDSDTYRQVAAETQAYLGWLKRFAEAKGWKADEG